MRPKYIFAWVAFWALLIAGSAEYFFAVGGPWRIQALRPYLLSGPSDAWSHNQLLIHDIKRQTKDGTSKGPRFILLGGSASLEAITSDDDVLIQLKQNGISPVQFDSLASSLKTMGDETKILHALKDIPATILIPVEILQFTKTATAQLNATTEYRVIRKYGGLATPARSIEIITRHGGALAWDESLSLFRGSMALGDSLRGFISRAAKGQPRTDYDRRAVGEMLPANEEVIQRNRAWLPKSLKQYARFSALNFDLLELLVQQAKASGQSIILLELPTNPIFDDLFEPYEKIHRRDLERFVAKHGIDYWDFKKELRFSPEHFNDIHHLRNIARPIFVKKLVRELAIYIRNKRSKS